MLTYRTLSAAGIVHGQFFRYHVRQGVYIAYIFRKISGTERKRPAHGVSIGLPGGYQGKESLSCGLNDTRAIVEKLTERNHGTVLDI
jgi:hypothetical protein